MNILTSLKRGVNISRFSIAYSSLSDDFISNRLSTLLPVDEPVDKNGSYCAASTGSLELISLTILRAANIIQGIVATVRIVGTDIPKATTKLIVGSGDEVGQGVGSGVFVGTGVEGSNVLAGLCFGVGLGVSFGDGANVFDKVGQMVGMNVLDGSSEGGGVLGGVDAK
jgi:hypothetical protein